jgi:histidyl-tRNA synthetase
VVEKFQAPKGTYDVLPPSCLSDKQKGTAPWTVSSHWIWLEELLRRTALQFGFEEIRTPIFEATGLFARTAGDASDVVSKEMYTFEDRGGRSLSLRPEGTAPAARALIEIGAFQPGAQSKVFYLEPMFRYERPQAGRFRQHSQFGVEWYGCSGPDAEVECMQLMWTVYQQLGLRGLSMQINTLGTREDRHRYREALVAYLQPHLSDLSEDSQHRFEKNPLRILDTKSPQDLAILEHAPRLMDHLSDESRRRFERVQEGLSALRIPFVVQPRLVRGFDYYTHTVWEVVAQGIGAQGSIGGGGRYDHLVQELGGPSCPGLGFGMGLERLMTVLHAEGIPLGPSQHVQAIVVPMGEEVNLQALQVAQNLRHAGLRIDIALDVKRLKTVLSRASDQGIRWVILLGSNEVEAGLLSLKDLSNGTQQSLSEQQVISNIQNIHG